jgi:hypothetical protein
MHRPSTDHMASGPWLNWRRRRRQNQPIIDRFADKFCFKHFKSPERARAPFQNIIREMIVLSQPSIREHPNIIRLEGICWDIPQDDQVWPVLVFQKAHFGDLYHFSRSGAGRDLSMEDRLSLCIDIGIAIRDMHSNSKASHTKVIV